MPSEPTSRLNWHAAECIRDPLARARERICDVLVLLEGCDNSVLPNPADRKKYMRKAIAQALQSLKHAESQVDYLVQQSRSR